MDGWPTYWITPEQLEEMYPMNEMQAIIELIREARKEKGTETGYRRAKRALRALLPNEEDQITILVHLDYYSPSTRTPYEWLAKRLATKKVPG